VGQAVLGTRSTLADWLPKETLWAAALSIFQSPSSPPGSAIAGSHERGTGPGETGHQNGEEESLDRLLYPLRGLPEESPLALACAYRLKDRTRDPVAATAVATSRLPRPTPCGREGFMIRREEGPHYRPTYAGSMPHQVRRVSDNRRVLRMTRSSDSGWGLPSRRSHLRRWWSLTPPFHPYLLRVLGRANGGLFSVMNFSP
jgi:hypothetical protein